MLLPRIRATYYNLQKAMPRAGHLDREDEDSGDGGEKLDCGELGGGAQAGELDR